MIALIANFAIENDAIINKVNKVVLEMYLHARKGEVIKRKSL